MTVDERLREIETTQARALTVLEALDEKMDRVDKILVGDGNGGGGHQVRLDRLEQGASRARRLFYTILVPVGLLLAKAVAGVLGTPEA